MSEQIQPAEAARQHRRGGTQAGPWCGRKVLAAMGKTTGNARYNGDGSGPLTVEPARLSAIACTLRARRSSLMQVKEKTWTYDLQFPH